jgi:hypothetical protein
MLDYLPWAEAAGVPHIVVDGAARATTVLTLSHWPNNTTPEPYRRETSTETALAWVAAHDPARWARHVTNNHFDEDGLFSMYAVHQRRDALARASLLADAARAGDFGTYRDRAAARLMFIVESWCDPRTSPLPRRVFAANGAARVASLYRAMLPRVPELADGIERLRAHWLAEDAHLDQSEEWLAASNLVIEEEPDLDLAIVRLPIEAKPRPYRRYLQRERGVAHPFAIHNATRCARLLRLQGRRIEFQYRYESWVAVPSCRPAPRVDLGEFCRWLNRRERHGRWIWEDALAVAPRLYRAGDAPSTLSQGLFAAELRRHLREQPPVWDAYNWRPPRA